MSGNGYKVTNPPDELRADRGLFNICAIVIPFLLISNYRINDHNQSQRPAKPSQKEVATRRLHFYIFSLDFLLLEGDMKTEKRKLYKLKQLNIEVPEDIFMLIKTASEKEKITVRAFVLSAVLREIGK